MIRVNGEESDARPGETVGQLLASLGLEADARGVAVAVDGQVLPRSSWTSFALADDARVEVLTAMQGG
jgi:sulfur carrier protein